MTQSKLPLHAKSFWNASPEGAFQQWLTDGHYAGEQLRPASVAIYLGMFKRLQAWLSEQGKSLFYLNEAALDAFLRTRQLAAEPRHRYLLLFTRLYRYLQALELASEDPAHTLLVSVPAPDRELPEALTPAELSLLLDAPVAGWKGIRQRAMMALIAASGVRLSEVLALPLASFSAGLPLKLAIPQTGVHPPRETRVHSFARAPLEIWRETRTAKGVAGDFLFPSNLAGDRMDDSTAIKDIRKRIASAGLSRRYEGPTLLRNTFGAMSLAHFSVEEVQEWMGHTLSRTTERLLPASAAWKRASLG